MASQTKRNLAIAGFRATAEAAFERGSLLSETVLRIGTDQRESERIPVIGIAGKAVERGPAEDVVPMNVGSAKPVATLRKREAVDYIDDNDNAITNVDLMSAYGDTLMNSVLRQMDADIIEAAKESSNAAYSRPGWTAVTNQIAYTKGSMNAGNLRKGVARIRAENAFSAGDLFLVFDALEFEPLAADNQLSSSDFIQGNRVTKEGMFETLYGCKPIMIPQAGVTEGDGALPDKRAYLWHRNAIGLVVNEGRTILGRVERVEQKTAYMLYNSVLCGAARAQNAGIINFVSP